jgi:hypothetical protein
MTSLLENPQEEVIPAQCLPSRLHLLECTVSIIIKIVWIVTLIIIPKFQMTAIRHYMLIILGLRFLFQFRFSYIFRFMFLSEWCNNTIFNCSSDSLKGDKGDKGERVRNSFKP